MSCDFLSLRARMDGEVAERMHEFTISMVALLFCYLDRLHENMSARTESDNAQLTQRLPETEENCIIQLQLLDFKLLSKQKHTSNKLTPVSFVCS